VSLLASARRVFGCCQVGARQRRYRGPRRPRSTGWRAMECPQSVTTCGMPKRSACSLASPHG
jgi:hypothetical protein